MTADVTEHFGAWHPADGQPCPVVRISMMTDVLNGFIVDAVIKPKAIGERLLAMEHMQHIGIKDLVLFDREYPAFWLFSEVRSSGAHFCARMNKGIWQVVDDFIATGLEERIVNLEPCVQVVKQCLKMGLPIEPIEVRLLRIVLDTGETEVLITSLVARKALFLEKRIGYRRFATCYKPICSVNDIDDIRVYQSLYYGDILLFTSYS